MCLLTLIPDYVVPDMKKFRVAADNNPDGFGFAILDGKTIIRKHSMEFEELADKFSDLRSTFKGPALFHFRFATHGAETIDNCHPFSLGGDPSTVMAHNGVLRIPMKPGEVRSDSRIFAEDIMPSIGGVTALDDDDYFVRLSEWAAGSKLVYLTANDDARFDWYIVNEKSGHWDGDMWWSNHSYKPWLPKYPAINYMTGKIADITSVREVDNRYDTFFADGIYCDADGVPIHTGDEIGVCLEKMDFFTSMTDDGKSVVDCMACGWTKTVDDDLEMVLICDCCGSCLFCGSDYGCTCWNAMLLDGCSENQMTIPFDSYFPPPIPLRPSGFY